MVPNRTLIAKSCNLFEYSQRHLHKFRQAGRSGLFHHIGPVDFNGSRANTKFTGDSFVCLPIEQSRQHILFPLAQGRKSLLDQLCFRAYLTRPNGPNSCCSRGDGGGTVETAERVPKFCQATWTFIQVREPFFPKTISLALGQSQNSTLNELMREMRRPAIKFRRNETAHNSEKKTNHVFHAGVPSI